MDLTGKLIKIAEGMYVEQDVLNIVAAVQEYDPNLSIKILNQGGIGDAPYVLVEKCRDGLERIVFEIWELDARVLERIRSADNARHNVLDIVDKKNEKAQLDLNQRYKERMMEAEDIVSTFMRSRSKTKWTVKDGDRLITIEDRGNH